MKYEDILKDEVIINKLKEIDANNTGKVLHGIKHAEGVIINVTKMCQLLNINDKDTNLLKMAALLHDIGQIYGNAKHCEKGYEFVNEYFKNKLNKEDLNKISLAILHHHDKEEISSMSLFNHILLICDKLDFGHSRINPFYLEKNPDDVACLIDRVDFEISENIFKVNIYLYKDIDKEVWEYYPKIKGRIKEFAKKINKDDEIEFIKEN